MEVKNAQEAFFTKAGRSGKMVLFLMGADAGIIALVGALTYWGIGWLRASP